MTVEKDLGILVMDSLKSKADTCRMLWAIQRSFASITPQMFQTFFSAFIRPLLEYGLPVAVPQSKGGCDSLERVQMRSTKTVCGMRQLAYDDRRSLLKLYLLHFISLRASATPWRGYK